jgi:hypothetical protein
MAAVRFLAAKRIATDWTQLALLVLHDPDDPLHGDAPRRYLAGSYYRTLAKD